MGRLQLSQWNDINPGTSKTFCMNYQSVNELSLGLTKFSYREISNTQTLRKGGEREEYSRKEPRKGILEAGGRTGFLNTLYLFNSYTEAKKMKTSFSALISHYLSSNHASSWQAENKEKEVLVIQLNGLTPCHTTYKELIDAEHCRSKILYGFEG